MFRINSDTHVSKSITHKGHTQAFYGSLNNGNTGSMTINIWVRVKVQ